MSTPSRPQALELTRQIGLYAATAITVGNIIGSGIFRSPHSVAEELTSFGLVLAAWVTGGLLSICGSLVIAELAVTHPRTGGLYVYIRESFGDAWGFVFGWANLWVIKPTVIASIASVFALYFCQVMGWPKSAEYGVGAGAILMLSFVNWLGVREGTRTQSLFTTLKVAGILGLCLAAFTLPASHPGTPLPAAAEASTKPLLVGFFVAMVSILFAYDGWTDSTYVAGEVKDPRRVMPIAIVWGTWLVIAVYVLTNVAYFKVLGPEGVAGYEAVGAETARRLMGEWGARALAVLVAVSTFGTTNGSILTGPRVTQAMAADGLLWRPLAALDARRRTPSLALAIQALLACAWLAVAGGFDDVSGWFVTTSWLFYGITTAALFAQRRREARGGLEAPSYRAPLYPLTPIVFILVTIAIIWSDFTSSTPLRFEGFEGPLADLLSLVPRAGLGVLVASLGFPVYGLFWARRRGVAR
jgi:amino acid transporter